MKITATGQMSNICGQIAKLVLQRRFFKLNGDVTKTVSSFDLGAASKFQQTLLFMECRQIWPWIAIQKRENAQKKRKPNGGDSCPK